MLGVFNFPKKYMTLSPDGSRKLLTKRQIKFITQMLFVVFSYQLTLSPAAAAALDAAVSDVQPEIAKVEQITVDIEEIDEKTRLPIAEEKIIIKSLGIKGVSAYNVGDVNQTDGDPCTSANGENICLALELGYKRCAANFVPFGTILEVSGFGQCMVTDRMNSRYQNHVDIAMKVSEKKDALKWGRRKVEVKLVKKATQI
jgi:3D (Asp-Asp-Asp) domain-containing protein